MTYQIPRLDQALKSENFAEAKGFLEQGDAPSEHTLVLACACNAPWEIVHLLLERGAAQVSYPWKSPLHTAAAKSSAEVVFELVKQGGFQLEYCKKDDRTTPLHAAASAANHPAVHELLRLGANPNTATQWGNTPLMSARTSPESVEWLLRAKADPHATNVYGATALDYAFIEAKRLFVLSETDPTHTHERKQNRKVMRLLVEQNVRIKPHHAKAVQIIKNEIRKDYGPCDIFHRQVYGKFPKAQPAPPPDPPPPQNQSELTANDLCNNTS